jgi:hypothetical protein
MKRVALPGLLLLGVAACQLPPERPALRPLPDEGPAMTYTDLYRRVRDQAEVAQERFMDNDWTGLEEMAQGLERSARFIAKSTDVPARNKDVLPEMTKNLSEEAAKLTSLAKEIAKLPPDEQKKKVKELSETMGRITLTVRELHPNPRN